MVDIVVGNTNNDEVSTLSNCDSQTTVKCDFLTPQLSSRRVRLRAVAPNDLPVLYVMVTHDEIAYRWRFNGVIPTYESFVKSLNVGVLIQFVVTSTGNNEVLGLVVAYNADLRNRHAYGVVLVTPRLIGSGIGMEAMALFLNYLFTTWDFRKIYFESLSFNFIQFRSGLGKHFHQEGLLRGHYYFADRYWDNHILALYRDEFLQHPTVRYLLGKKSEVRKTRTNPAEPISNGVAGCSGLAFSRSESEEEAIH